MHYRLAGRGRTAPAFARIACLALASPALLGSSADSQFKVTASVARSAHLSASPVGKSAASMVKVTNAVSLRLPVGAEFRLRLEKTETAVESVEISGLGRTIKVGAEPVEMTIPESLYERGELNLSLQIRFRDGAKPQGSLIPLQIMLLP